MTQWYNHHPLSNRGQPLTAIQMTVPDGAAMSVGETVEQWRRRVRKRRRQTRDGHGRTCRLAEEAGPRRPEHLELLYGSSRFLEEEPRQLLAIDVLNDTATCSRLTSLLLEKERAFLVCGMGSQSILGMDSAAELDVGA
jgi:hypothetical protein